MAGEGGGGVMKWKIGIDMYTLIWITNKNLLFKKINKIQKKKKALNDVTLCLKIFSPQNRAHTEEEKAMENRQRRQETRAHGDA